MTESVITNGQPPMQVAVRVFADLLPLPPAVFPLVPRGKQPLTKNGFKTATTDPKQIGDWCKRHPTANVGIVPGMSGCLAVDIDSVEARTAAESLGLYAEPTLAIKTGRANPDGSPGEHLWFLKPDGQREIGNLTLLGSLTIRSDAGYVVAPPSVHPSGTLYKIVNAVTPLDCPPKLVDALARAQKKTSVSLFVVGSDGVTATDVGDSPAETNGQATEDGNAPVPVGERHTRLVRYSAQLARKGLTLTELRRVIKSWALDVMPNLENLDSVIESACLSGVRKYGRVGDETIDVGAMVDLLNRKYAFVRSQNVVMRITEEGIVHLLSVGDLRHAEANLPMVSEGKRMRTAVDMWLTSPDRREFESMIFAPPPVSAPHGSYNVFRGWAVTPNPNQMPERFIDHVAEVVADGSDELFLWIMGWLANIVQTPGLRTGTSLVLIGQQGTGKSIVGDAMGRILGSSRVVASQMGRLTGRFNSHLAHCLLAQAEEAFWGGDKAAEGALKDLITGRERLVEWKGHEPITMSNYTRLLVTSNQDRVIPASFDQRRWAVVRVNSSRRGNHAYFAPLWKEILSEEGSGALLHYLQNYDLKDIPIMHAPATEALREQKEESADAWQQWWMEVLHAASCPGEAPMKSSAGTAGTTDADAAERTIESMFSSFLQFCDRMNLRYPGTKVRFSREMRALQVLVDTGNDNNIVWRQLVDGRRAKCWIVRPLRTCRANFEALIGHQMQWETRATEWAAPEPLIGDRWKRL